MVLTVLVLGASAWTAITRHGRRIADHESAADPVASTEAGQQTARPPLIDVAVESGLEFVHRNGASGEYHLYEIMSGGGGFLDYDGDGNLDIFLVQGGQPESEESDGSHLYRNLGDGRFRDVTEEAGASVGGSGIGCAAADFDRDGDVDLYVTRVGPDVLLRNEGDGTFHDATSSVGLGDDGFSSSAAFLDYDRDGWPDLFVARYTRWHSGLERRCKDSEGRREYCDPNTYERPHHLLYRNRRDGTFEDASHSAGIDLATGYGLAVLCSDWDEDGWVDIFVANDQSAGLLWKNQQDGTFREVAIQSGCAFNGSGAPIAGMGTAADDMDGDGDLDLFITNISMSPNLFLENDAGQFRDVSHRWGESRWNRPYTGFGVVVFDQDHDGAPDMFVANGAVLRSSSPALPSNAYAEPNQLLRRDGENRFRDASQELGPGLLLPDVARGVAYGDYDNDGDVDLLVCRNNSRPLLLRNDPPTRAHWIVVSPVQEPEQGPVLNARVTLVAEERTWVREVLSHQSYLSASDPRLHFGLGSVERLREIVVRWPDGGLERWEGVGADRFVTLRRGEGQGL